MKKLIRMVMLSAMMVWGAQSMAQTRGAIFFGASIPTGDYGKFDNMSDFALTTPDASYAGAAIQDLVSGLTIEKSKVVVDGVTQYDFSFVSWFWIGAAILSVICALTVWNAKHNE